MTDRSFINVDIQMRTNVPRIFAIGDIVGQPMPARKAVHEVHVAAEVVASKLQGNKKLAAVLTARAQSLCQSDIKQMLKPRTGAVAQRVKLAQHLHL